MFKAFADMNDDIQKLHIDGIDIVSNFAYPLIFKNKDLFKKYLKKFKDANVEVRPIIGGDITKQPFYDGEKIDNSTASIIHKQGFYIPNNPDLSDDELKTICEMLKYE
jgi:CDP-6-deoxy-D-xylo-4-hexulose-3-dehydrase